MKTNLFILSCLWLLIAPAFGQAADNQGLQQLVASEFANSNAPTVHPFSLSHEAPAQLTQSVVNGAKVLLKTPELEQLTRQRPGNVRLILPLPDGSIVTLKLTSALSPFSEDFVAQSGATDLGLHYKGVVEGQANSIAALSFFDRKAEIQAQEGAGEMLTEDVMGVLSFGGSTFVIGNHQGKLLIYNDSEILVPNLSSCSTAEPTDDFLDLVPVAESLVCRQTKVQFDCDYRMYTDKGSSVANVENYVSGFFNVVQALFLVDNFEVVISEIFVYTSTDPYAGTGSSSSYLSQFRAEKIATGINGNMAHLLSTRPAGLGGIAYLAGNLCGGNNRVCFSNISNSFSSFPFYSWTVDVTSHEMGHVMGSPHTHNCGWDGGALDNCFSTEGSCPPGPTVPSSGGTVMSYCHLTSAGKDFSLGFADQPAMLIQNYINLNTCLDPCSWSPPIGQCANYCASAGLSSSQEWIESVSIGDLSNVSGNDGGYLDYGLSSATFKIGETYALSLTPGFSGATHNEYFRVWMDFNRNGTFNDPNELVFDQSTGGGSLSGSFTVPIFVDTGRIGLRVQMKRNSSAEACESFSQGEVEDYCVQLSVNPCPIPVSQNVNISSPTSATISWSNEFIGGYEVRGRKAGGAWLNFITISPAKSYGGFKAGKTYEWQVRSICADTISPYSPIHSFTMPTARTASSKAALSFEIYPNPAQNNLSVNLSGTALSASNISLFDARGQLVLSQEINRGASDLKLDLSNLPAGFYKLVLRNAEAFESRQLIIAR